MERGMETCCTSVTGDSNHKIGCVLVTGGGGFLGRHIVRKLLDAGEEVRVIGRKPYPDLQALGVECVQGDLTDSAACLRAVSACQAIIHTAAQPGIWGDYASFYRNNFLATQTLLDAAVSTGGVKKFLYTSTPSVVYGRQGIDGGDETLPYPDTYLTAYAGTKALAEKLVLAAAGNSFAAAAIRPHLIFGPGDNHLIPKLLARARAGSLRIIGAGRNRISVSYVENVADAHVLAVRLLEPGGKLSGRAYFVNEPEPVNCWDFINRLVTGAGMPPVRKRVPYGVAYAAGWLCEKYAALVGQKEDPRLTRFLVAQLGTSHWFRVDRARRDFGWEPRVDLEEGVRRCLSWQASGSA